MKLSSPFEIGSRLLPSLRIGDGVLSLEYERDDSHGRNVYRWYVDIPSGEYTDADLRSGCQGCSTQEMFGTFLSFLDAVAEAYHYNMRTGRESDNADLFPSAVAEWAYQNADEIGMLRMEIEESGAVLIED